MHVWKCAWRVLCVCQWTPISTRQKGVRALCYLCLFYVSPVWKWRQPLAGSACVTSFVSVLSLSVSLEYMLSFATGWTPKKGVLSSSLGRDPGHQAGPPQLGRSGPGLQQLEEVAMPLASLHTLLCFKKLLRQKYVSCYCFPSPLDFWNSRNNVF